MIKNTELSQSLKKLEEDLPESVGEKLSEWEVNACKTWTQIWAEKKAAEIKEYLYKEVPQIFHNAVREIGILPAPAGPYNIGEGEYKRCAVAFRITIKEHAYLYYPVLERLQKFVEKSGLECMCIDMTGRGIVLIG